MNEMERITSRADVLISAITEAMMAPVEAAAERMALAVKVAQITGRMEAHAMVLDTIAAHKDRLLAGLAGMTGARRALALKHVELLEAQELAILTEIEVPAEIAQQAVKGLPAPIEQPTHKRDGRRFARVNGVHAE